MVAQEILDLLVWVRALVPEPFFYLGAMVKRLRRRPLKAKVAGSNPATSSRLLADDARSFSMYKNTDKRYTHPIKTTEASVRMEGCQVTPQMREQCQRALRGEVTTAELLRRFSKPAER